MSEATYSRLQIGLHWLVAMMIVLLWLIEDEAVHVPLGLAMFAALAVRVLVRLVRGVPGPAEVTSPAMARVARWGHLALYALMFLAAGLGVVYWLDGGDAMEDAHELASNALMLVALGHAAAAIWHQAVLRDGTMARMRLRPR